MTRDEVRIRSEGALDAAEQVLTRVENMLKAPDWVARVRAQTMLPNGIDDTVVQIARLDLATGAELAIRRTQVAELARTALKQLGVESTATRLDDLIAQLVARAQVAEPAPRRLPRGVIWLILALAAVGAIFTLEGPAMAGVILIIVILLGVANRYDPR